MMMINTSLGMPICAAIAANTGTNKAAEAVLLVNSVKKMMKVATAKITTNGEASPNALAKVWPNTKDAPESFNTALKVKPPPNSINTPQSVLSEICFHVAVPKITTKVEANKAIQVSVWLKPKASVNWPLKIHATAVQTNNNIAKMRSRVQGMSSV